MPSPFLDAAVIANPIDDPLQPAADLALPHVYMPQPLLPIAPAPGGGGGGQGGGGGGGEGRRRWLACRQ